MRETTLGDREVSLRDREGVRLEIEQAVKASKEHCFSLMKTCQELKPCQELNLTFMSS